MEKLQDTADVASRKAPRYSGEMVVLLVATAPPYHPLATGRELLAPLADRECTGRSIRSIAEAETTGPHLGPHVGMVDIDGDAIP